MKSRPSGRSRVRSANRPKRGPDPRRLVRPLVRELHAYTPGEQPKIPGLIKLNTNENPYPPSPKVIEAVRAATDARLRLYPDPTADRLRDRLARLHGCTRDHIIVGNGSDELLALAVRAFVEPWVSTATEDTSRDPHPRTLVQYFTPSYSLYPVLAAIHGAVPHEVPLPADFALPTVSELRRARPWAFSAALSLITTPNAPGGRGYSTRELEALCAATRGVVLLDEAYADFADQNAMSLALQFRHVLVARTFSKGYSLCFQRVGYLVGDPVLIGALHKIRDSYNVNGLGQVAALATLADLPYYRRQFRKVRHTRARLATDLTEMGFRVLPSQTNFLLVEPPRFAAIHWHQALRDRRILVRWFSSPTLEKYLRITIGTDEQASALVSAAQDILSRGNRPSARRRTR